MKNAGGGSNDWKKNMIEFWSTSVTVFDKKFVCLYYKIGDFILRTLALESGIDVAPGINVTPGTFGKNIKRSP